MRATYSPSAAIVVAERGYHAFGSKLRLSAPAPLADPSG